MNKLLSNSDIEPYVKKVVVYSDLESLTPSQILKMLPMAILYQQKKNVGHWTLLTKTPEGIEFFDPYGYPVDTEFKMLEWKQPHYLANILSKLADKVQINYNQYDFQSKMDGVNTCGRWILLRQWLSDMTIDQFKNAINKAVKKLGITTDELVVEATSG